MSESYYVTNYHSTPQTLKNIYDLNESRWLICTSTWQSFYKNIVLSWNPGMYPNKLFLLYYSTLCLNVSNIFWKFIPHLCSISILLSINKIDMCRFDDLLFCMLGKVLKLELDKIKHICFYLSLLPIYCFFKQNIIKDRICIYSII